MPGATGYQNPVYDPMSNPAGFNKHLAQVVQDLKNMARGRAGFEISCAGSYKISNILLRITCEILQHSKLL